MIIVDPYEKVPFTDFLPELQLEMPEVPDEILMNYVRSAAIEFATKTGLIQRTVEIYLEPCVENYLIESLDCLVINKVSGVCINGRPITRVPALKCDRVPCGNGMVMWWEEPNMAFFSPAPTIECIATIFMSVIPADDACDVDKFLLSKYKTVIQHGARAMLYAIPRRPWSDGTMATRSEQLFNKGINRANVRRVLGNQNGVIRNGFNTRFNR